MRVANKERDVAILHYVQQGRTYKEIGAIFNISDVAVMKSYRRAQKYTVADVMNLSTDVLAKKKGKTKIEIDR